MSAVESLETDSGFIEIVGRIVLKRDEGMSEVQYLYIVVLNRAIEPKSKAVLGTWLKATAIGECRDLDWSTFDSVHFWDQMGKVEAKDVEAIGDEVAHKVVSVYDTSLDCLLYDKTNFFLQMSQETPSDLTRYSYYKAGNNELRHVVLLLICKREEGIQLFQRTYPAYIQAYVPAVCRDGVPLAVVKKGSDAPIFDNKFNSPEIPHGSKPTWGCRLLGLSRRTIIPISAGCPLRNIGRSKLPIARSGARTRSACPIGPK